MAANPRAVLRALKSAPPRNGQQVSSAGPYGGFPAPYLSPGPSPLVQSYNEWQGARQYGENIALPRDWRQYLSGMFGPLAPIMPVPIDIPEPEGERPEPRRWQYPVGWDMPMGMPGTEGVGKLADFQTLRTLADLYSVARSAIELRKAELRGIGWDIAPTSAASKAMRGDHKAAADFAERRAQAVRFFRRPDPNYADFSSWFNAILEELFVTDALSLYIHPSRVPSKGVLGSSIAALDLIDGSLIRPLIDVRGGSPAPPNPAYQQFEYGVPRVDLMTLLLEEDIEDGVNTLMAEYKGDQLLYLPYTPRVWTPYGQAPIERAIIPIMSGLRKQQYQLDYFDQGTIPGLFVTPGNTDLTPSQLRELQDALNAIAGDQAWKHRIIVLPGGSKTEPQVQATLSDEFDLMVQTQVVMAFDVLPWELGIMAQVSAAMSNSATTAEQYARASMNLTQRKSTIPLLLFFKSAIFDRILQDVCGQWDMEWQWEGLQEVEQAGQLTEQLVEQVSAGLVSIDEARQELGRDPWDLPITSDPGWATQWGGFVPLTGVTGATATPLGGTPGPGQPTAGTPEDLTEPAVTGAHPGAPPPVRTVPRNRLSGAQRREQARQVSVAQNKPNTVPGTPAHTAARSVASGVQGRARKTTGFTLEALTTDAATDVPKAERELSLLRSYLNRGEPVSAWQPRHITPRMLSQVAEYLAKGMSPSEACDAVKAVLPKHAHHEGMHHVYAYLARHYPPSVLDWVKDTTWCGPVTVPLKDIEMGRRPGGARDESKVRDIARRVEAGEHLDPVVLVRAPGKKRLEIADGWHRTDGVKRAGKKKILAWVGDVKNSDWVGSKEINEHKLNKASIDELHEKALTADGRLAHNDPAFYLKRWYDEGAGGRIQWGQPGDLTACHAIASKYMTSDQAWGFCNERHHDRLGTWNSPSDDAEKAIEGVVVEAPKAAWPQWSLDQLAAEYAQKLSNRLGATVNAGQVARKWRQQATQGKRGKQRYYPTPRQYLDQAGITAAILLVVTEVLHELWREAWRAGWSLAVMVLGEDITAADAALAALLKKGRKRISWIVQTRLNRLERALLRAVWDSSSTADLAREINGILASLTSALLVAQTETTWAAGAAVTEVYRKAGVTHVRWVTRHDSRVCERCRRNEAAGPVPLGRKFPSGERHPPAHPRCRCRLEPAQPPQPPLPPATPAST